MAVGAGGRAVGSADEVGLVVRATQTLVPFSQASVEVRQTEAHAVTLLTRVVPGLGVSEDHKLTLTSSSAAAVLQTSGVAET